ncbi:afadin-like [Myotis myotis]|uniref:afadin-like n=1 Tax=Myotis myotis TaxID=51298 RepID=UPI00174CD21D|nr:afadin-like [Myotis myotis]
MKIWHPREQDNLNVMELNQGTRILKLPEVLRSQRLKSGSNGQRKTIQFSLDSNEEETTAPRSQDSSAASSRTSLLLRVKAPSRNSVTPRSKEATRTALLRSATSTGAAVPVLAKPDPVSIQVSWDPRGFWAMDTSTKLRPQEPGILPTREDSSSPPPSYFRLISDFLKPEKPTKAAMGLIKKTVEVLKLDHQIRETKIQQKMVTEEAAFLLNEKLPVQAGTTVMLANLTNKAKEYRKEIENQWHTYAQVSGETLPTKQELASKYAKQTSDFKTTPLLGKEILEYSLKQQLEAVRDMSQVREKQQKELQTLQKKLKKARAKTAAKAQARYLQEKALLEKQLNEPAMGMMGKREEKELKRKVRALEVAAEKRASELQRLRAEEEESHQEVEQQPQQPPVDKTPQSWLKLQKGHLQKHWSVKRIPERPVLQPVAPGPPQAAPGPPQAAPGPPQAAPGPPQAAPGPPHVAPRSRRRSSVAIDSNQSTLLSKLSQIQ